ncbi:8092_t:CDS:1, partial [Dentiscutata erythropus]
MRIHEEKRFKYKINAFAYMDDTTYISQDKKQMEKILKTVEEFSQIT